MFSSLYYRGDSVFRQNVRLQKRNATLRHYILLKHGKQVIVFVTKWGKYK